LETHLPDGLGQLEDMEDLEELGSRLDGKAFGLAPFELIPENLEVGKG